MGRALKQAKVEGLRIVGHDKEPTNASKAQKLGAVDKVEWNIIEATKDAGVVIVATPVMAIKDVMEAIGPHVKPGCVVTDTGSTKAQVLKWAEEILPKGVSFVGGHPMAGKETSGPENAEADLFRGAVYCVIPAKDAAPEAVQAVVGIAELVGAKPFFLSVGEHESFVAAVSHLPIVLSAALVSSTSKSPSWHEMSKLAASAYRDVTRLASGDPEMNRDICMTNRQEIVSWIDRMIAELLEFKRLMNENEKGLAQVFANVHEARERWVNHLIESPGGQASVGGLPSAGERLSSLLVGELLSKKGKAMMDRYENKDGKSKK